MLRAVVSTKVAGKREFREMFHAVGADMHMLLKSISISFQSECRKAGLIADVHAENVLEMLVEEYGLIVKIGNDSDFI